MGAHATISCIFKCEDCQFSCYFITLTIYILPTVGLGWDFGVSGGFID